jgi:hypothetical protein
VRLLRQLEFLVKFVRLRTRSPSRWRRRSEGGWLMTGWVLFLVVLAHAGDATDNWSKLPIATTTSAVFATAQACNAAGQDLRQHFGEKFTWLCEPQSR